MKHTHCWLCERRFYRGRYGVISVWRETSAGRQALHVSCGQRFDTEGESAAVEMVRLERKWETRHT